MMLRWKIERRVISELFFNNENVINPWGIETADSSAFFSLEEGKGWRYQILKEDYLLNDKQYRAELITRMKEGLWSLEIKDNISEPNCVARKARLNCLEDSFFMDFVMRFRFKKEFIQYAEIAGKRYYHHDTNIYYQYPAEAVFLKGRDFDVTISVIDKKVPDKMRCYMYVRDRADEWVVHARMLPCQWDKEVLKLCNVWAGTRPLPQVLTNIILKSEKARKRLWYRSESAPYKNKILRLINPNVFPMVRIGKGEELVWNITVQINEKKDNK